MWNQWGFTFWFLCIEFHWFWFYFSQSDNKIIVRVWCRLDSCIFRLYGTNFLKSVCNCKNKSYFHPISRNLDDWMKTTSLPDLLLSSKSIPFIESNRQFSLVYFLQSLRLHISYLFLLAIGKWFSKWLINTICQ